MGIDGVLVVFAYKPSFRREYGMQSILRYCGKNAMLQLLRAAENTAESRPLYASLKNLSAVYTFPAGMYYNDTTYDRTAVMV